MQLGSEHKLENFFGESDSLGMEIDTTITELPDSGRVKIK